MYLNNGDGEFTPGSSFGRPESPTRHVNVADLNADSHTDVIVGHVEARPVIYFNDGTGRFSAVHFGDDRGIAYGFATGDVDEDGVTDIAMARSNAPTVLYFGSDPETPAR